MGFTLIELMVVIVIIGVLASLAIPRFTEASDKAKVAEAPRVLASYESAALASLAENNYYDGTGMIFDMAAVNADSKWFQYSATPTNTATTAEATAATRNTIGKFGSGAVILALDASGIASRSCSSVDCAKFLPNFKLATPPAGGGE
jgi:prepilin-type N-terminal cleavage/methylation domain-containing protein